MLARFASNSSKGQAAEVTDFPVEKQLDYRMPAGDTTRRAFSYAVVGALSVGLLTSVKSIAVACARCLASLALRSLALREPASLCALDVNFRFACVGCRLRLSARSLARLSPFVVRLCAPWAAQVDLVETMSASADVLAMANIEVDLASIPEGASACACARRQTHRARPFNDVTHTRARAWALARRSKRCLQVARQAVVCAQSNGKRDCCSARRARRNAARPSARRSSRQAW